MEKCYKCESCGCSFSQTGDVKDTKIKNINLVVNQFPQAGRLKKDTMKSNKDLKSL